MSVACSLYGVAQRRSDRNAGRLRGHLVVNPAVGFFHPVPETGGRFPAKVFSNEGVVAVAAIDAPGSAKIVASLQFNACDLLDDIHQLVDGDHF